MSCEQKHIQQEKGDHETQRQHDRRIGGPQSHPGEQEGEAPDHIAHGDRSQSEGVPAGGGGRRKGV